MHISPYLEAQDEVNATIVKIKFNRIIIGYTLYIYILQTPVLHVPSLKGVECLKFQKMYNSTFIHSVEDVYYDNTLTFYRYTTIHIICMNKSGV